MSDGDDKQPVGDAPVLTQMQARTLGALMLLCLQELGGNGVMIDEDDAPSVLRMARIGTSLIVCDFAADPSKGRMRRVDLYFHVAQSGEQPQPFPLGPSTRPASFQAKHLASPPDWHLQIDRPPEQWLEHAILSLESAVKDRLERC